MYYTVRAEEWEEVWVSMEIERLNKTVLNCKAKAMLDRLGQHPDGSALYCVQLALWGLEQGGIEAESSVIETTRAMMAWRPERLMNFFMLSENVDGYGPEGWKAAKTPLEFALIVVHDIEEKMMIHFPWCFSCE